MKHVNCVLLLLQKKRDVFIYVPSTTVCWNWWAAFQCFWVRSVSSGTATSLPPGYFQSRSCPCCCYWFKTEAHPGDISRHPFFFFHFSALPLPMAPAYRCVPEISPLTSVQLWLVSFTGFHKEKKIFAVGIVVFLIHLLFLMSLIYPGVSNTLYAFQ